jgi:hypothetical protein
MFSRRSIPILVAVIACALSARPAHATFHLMQIEQAIGGVGGNLNAQAIQLRMRGSLQAQVQLARIRAWDAAGANPVLIIDMGTPVTNSTAGDRVLITTATFKNHLVPSVTPDFIMTNPIPAAYMAAGSLTFETDDGLIIYWRLSWGGAGYTGSGTVSTFNDADGVANPPFAFGVPSTSLQALNFPGTAGALSVSNAADYLITAGASVWTNNARSSGTLNSVAGVGDPSDISSVQLGAPSPNPGSGAFSYSVALPRAGHALVAMYSVGGKLVRTLIDGDLPAGVHEYSWNSLGGSGERLASGVYYVRLESEGVRRSQKFVLLR